MATEAVSGCVLRSKLMAGYMANMSTDNSENRRDQGDDVSRSHTLNKAGDRPQPCS
jgi:hypothetical protein